MTLLLLGSFWGGAGCLDRLYEAPLVLASGLGEARSLAPDGAGNLLVVTGSAIVRIDGKGAILGADPGTATAVCTQPGRIMTLHDGVIDGVAVAGAIDLLCSWHDEILVLWPDAVRTLGGEKRWGGLADARALSLGPDGSVLVVTRTALLRDGSPVVELTDGRAAATDRQGRIFVADGETLWRVDGSTKTVAARWLSDPRDLHFGAGELLPGENLYVASGGGTVDYLRPAP